MQSSDASKYLPQGDINQFLGGRDDTRGFARNSKHAFFTAMRSRQTLRAFPTKRLGCISLTVSLHRARRKELPCSSFSILPLHTFPRIGLPMLNNPPKICVCACAAFMTLICTVSTLQADIVLDSGAISTSELNANDAGGFLSASSSFTLVNSDIPNVQLETNFSLIDAGIEVIVNGTTLYSTGADLSNFGPAGLFVATPTQPDNIDFSFDPNANGLPRLTAVSDITGTSFSGTSFVNSTNTVDFIEDFDSFSQASSPVDFTSLLQAGDNVIEIRNLNNFDGAQLAGDFTVTRIVAAQAVPEPSSLALCLAGSALLLARRRRN